MDKNFENVIKHPSPDTNVSTSPSRGEVLNNHRFCAFCIHPSSVIRGRKPANLFATHSSILRHCRTCSGNLDQRVKPVDDCGWEYVSSGNGKEKEKHLTNILLKCLDVVRQYAVLFERRVQSSTRAKKVQVVTRQTNPTGRSMIEMLGVLAIVGVLSVGGIAGYSKAMFMWRSNIQRNLIAGLLHSSIDLKLRLNHQTIPFQKITSVLDSLGNIPEGAEYKNERIYTKEGFDVYLAYGLRTMQSRLDGHTYQQNQYTIYFTFNQGGTALNLSEEDFCHNLLQVSKEVADEISDITFWKTDSASTSPNGDTGIVLYSGNSLRDASVTEMRQKCKMVFTETGFAHFNISLKYN